jgi:hypothetical protein
VFKGKWLAIEILIARNVIAFVLLPEEQNKGRGIEFNFPKLKCRLRQIIRFSGQNRGELWAFIVHSSWCFKNVHLLLMYEVGANQNKFIAGMCHFCYL